jgi:small subunit ribosomal protein S17
MKTLKGKVISVKAEKTAVVLVERSRIHPLYRKVLRSKKKYPVHDCLGVKEGDQVAIRQSRPISKTKKWKIAKVLSDSKK